MNEIQKTNIKKDEKSEWEKMLSQIQQLQEQQNAMMEKIKQESSQKLTEIQTKIDEKKKQISILQTELSSLETEKSKILTLLGMKNTSSNSNNVRNNSRVKYEYHGIIYTSATSLIQSLPDGISVLQEYPHSSWALILQRIQIGIIPPRIQRYQNFLDEIKNVKIIQ